MVLGVQRFGFRLLQLPVEVLVKSLSWRAGVAGCRGPFHGDCRGYIRVYVGIYKV